MESAHGLDDRIRYGSLIYSWMISSLIFTARCGGEPAALRGTHSTRLSYCNGLKYTTNPPSSLCKQSEKICFPSPEPKLSI